MRINTNHIEGYWLEECLFLLVLVIQTALHVVYDAAMQADTLSEQRS